MKARWYGLLSWLEDHKVVREVTVRKREHNAFLLGCDAGESNLRKRIAGGGL